MTDTVWTGRAIQRLFRMGARSKSLQSLYHAEKTGAIPESSRVSRGSIKVRYWDVSLLPAIGKKFGFLQPPEKQKVLVKFIQKGGVLKTSTTYNEARIFALNGIRTLVIGLDSECSITDLLSQDPEVESLDQNTCSRGLIDFFAGKCDINDVILKTDLPTLDYIPETHGLVILDKWLAQQNRREYVFQDKLIPKLKDYEVIIFDNGPNWNSLISNSILCSDTIISPLGCELLAYNASKTNLGSIKNFADEMKTGPKNHIMFATMLDRPVLSQQIYSSYLTDYIENIINIPIRRSSAFQEAILNKQSILEFSPSSPVGADYYELITELWARVVTNDVANITAQKLQATNLEVA